MVKTNVVVEIIHRTQKRSRFETLCVDRFKSTNWSSLELRWKFHNELRKECTNEDWLYYLHRGSKKTMFEICKEANGELKYIRAIQGHSGGRIISPELMNYVQILYKWNQFICHTGPVRGQYSIADDGVVAGGKESKEGRQTIFFTPLDPFHSDASEEETRISQDQEKYDIIISGDPNKMQ